MPISWRGIVAGSWLTDAQWARLAPHLPTDVRGVPREDDLVWWL
jgi:transposase